MNVFFAIQAIEATDVASNEQMCVSVCWDSKEYVIFEEPISLVKLTKAGAATIFAVLKDVLLRCILPVNTCK